jgi:hypothetical protein
MRSRLTEPADRPGLRSWLNRASLLPASDPAELDLRESAEHFREANRFPEYAGASWGSWPGPLVTRRIKS